MYYIKKLELMLCWGRGRLTYVPRDVSAMLCPGSLSSIEHFPRKL